jgi:hypothetical protein
MKNQFQLDRQVPTFWQNLMPPSSGQKWVSHHGNKQYGHRKWSPGIGTGTRGKPTGNQ